MLNTRLIILLLASLSACSIQAQTYFQDAARFTHEQPFGTARFTAVGGAFTSVGADFSNLSNNPGGLGMYRSSVITITPNIGFQESSSSYLNASSGRGNLSLTLGSLGLVFTNTELKRIKNELIRSTSFSFGLNQLADYNSTQDITAANNNFQGSISNAWLQEISAVNGQTDGAVNEDLFSFEAVNAYQTYLVNFVDSPAGYVTPITNSVSQNIEIDNSGYKYEAGIGAGMNFLDKVYFGGAIGIPIVNYERNTSFIERDIADGNGAFQNLTWQENYQTTGRGFNVKLGLIYRPTKFLRWGVALHSPEKLFFTESFNSSITTVFDTAVFNHVSPNGTFDYSMRMPWKIKTGFSFIIKENGFISIDYNLTDEGYTKYDFGDFASTAKPINDALSANYGLAHSISIGAEAVIQKFRLRGGYNYFGSSSALRNDIHRFSAGAGYMWEKFALDVAGQYAMSDESYIPYSVDGQTPNSFSSSVDKVNVQLTLSYRLK